MEKYKANHQAPVQWCGLRRACICTICGQGFKGQRHPNDKGSFPMRNRARGKAIKHVNDTHLEDTDG